MKVSGNVDLIVSLHVMGLETDAACVNRYGRVVITDTDQFFDDWMEDWNNGCGELMGVCEGPYQSSIDLELDDEDEEDDEKEDDDEEEEDDDE